MATDKQREANRLNAEKSCGPRTEEGKRTSSRNSRKLGIHIADAALYDEPDSAEDIERTLDDYINAYQPTFPHQRDCLEEIVICKVLLRRLLRTGTGILNESRERVLVDEVYTTPEGKPIRRFDLANFPPEEHRVIANIHLGVAWSRVQGAMEAISKQESRIAARLRRAGARAPTITAPPRSPATVCRRDRSRSRPCRSSVAAARSTAAARSIWTSRTPTSTTCSACCRTSAA